MGPNTYPSRIFTNRIFDTALESVVIRGPWAKGTEGAGICSHVLPPFSVLAIVVQDPVEQDEIPRTKPTLVEINDADSGSNPDGKGVPAGA